MKILDKLFGHKNKTSNATSVVNEIHTHPSKSLPNFELLDNFNQINSIFDFIFNPDDQIAQNAALNIHRLLKQVPFSKNKEAYETFRYIRINNTDINTFDRFPYDVRISLLCIASLNGNGYTREEVLDKFRNIKEQRIFPFVLFRLADWVHPIREKAEQIIEEYIIDENAVFFIQNQKLINWLLKVYRKDLSVLYNKIIALITTTELEQNQLKSFKEGERLFYYKCLIQNKANDTNIINALLTDKYYLVRHLVFSILDKTPNKKDIILRLLADKSHKIKQSAITYILDNEIVEFQTILEILIYDNSSIIRFKSRKLLSKIEELDFKQLYIEKIERSEYLLGSILGLSEVGNKEDISIILKFLDVKESAIQSAALFGLYNLDNHLATELSYQIIEQSYQPKTKKAAAFILAKEGIVTSRLRTIYDLTDYSGKKVILVLINKFGGWSAAGDYLKAMTENNDRLSMFAKLSLETWNKYSVSLGTKQTVEDKEYVLNWYMKVKNMGIQVPDDIPFIFGEKDRIIE